MGRIGSRPEVCREIVPFGATGVRQIGFGPDICREIVPIGATGVGRIGFRAPVCREFVPAQRAARIRSPAASDAPGMTSLGPHRMCRSCDERVRARTIEERRILARAVLDAARGEPLIDLGRPDAPLGALIGTGGSVAPDELGRRMQISLCCRSAVDGGFEKANAKPPSRSRTSGTWRAASATSSGSRRNTTSTSTRFTRGAACPICRGGG